jgi:hypothetical protein
VVGSRYEDIRTNVLSLDAQYRLTVAIDPGTTPNAPDISPLFDELDFHVDLREEVRAAVSHGKGWANSARMFRWC